MADALTTGISGVLFSTAADAAVADAGALSMAQRDIVVTHHGSVVDTNGLGVMAAFDGVANALGAACDLAALGPLQVGVAFGEVTVGDDARVGEAVIEAARLSESADAGTALIAESLRDAVVGDDRISLRLLGVQELKGLPEPIGVYEVEGKVDLAGDRTPRWVAVLSIDMVESSSLLTAIGEAATLRLRAQIRSIVDEHVAAVGGTVVDSVGDGLTAVAPLATGGLIAAGAIHRSVAALNLRADSPAEVHLRVGLAAGPLEAAGHALRGEAVLEAAALEGRAPIGATALAARVHGLISAHLKPTVEPLDDQAWVAPNTGPPEVPLPSALDATGAFRFVGRTQQLRELRRTWDAAMDTRCGLALVSGEPGIGKTRLVSELAQSVRAGGAVVLYGVCDADVPVPYQPFVGALRQLADAGVDGVDPSVIAGVLAGMGTGSSALAPTDPAAATSARDRGVLFERVAGLLEATAAHRPVLVVLDDLHWAARSTVQLLQYVLSSVSSGRVLIAATFRDMEVDDQHPLHALLAHQVEGVGVGRVALAGLEADDVADFVRQHPAQRLDDSAHALAVRVHSDSGGSPFFTAQLLSEMMASGTLRCVDDVWTVAAPIDHLPISESVRGVVNQRLERVGSDVRAALTLAAVIGHDFELDLLAEALDRSPDAVLEQVELAARSGLVVEGDHGGSFRFVHAIVRSALLDALSATRRMQMHRRVGEALERLPDQRIGDLAHHWVQAASVHDRRKAIDYLRLAARRDANALAWEAAASRCREVLDLLEAEEQPDLSVVAETWLAMGQALRAEGDLEYLPTMEEAARRARRAGRPDLLAHAAMGSLKPGTWFANANETDQMLIGLCEDALYLLPFDDPLRVRVLATLATNLTFEHGQNRERREKLIDEALGLARSIGDVELLSAALVAEFLALWDPTTYERRVEVADELHLLARRTGDDEVRFLAGFFRASCLLEAADVDGAIRELSALDDAIASTENFWFQFLVERVTTAIRIMRCEPDMGAEVDALFERSADTQADGAGTWAAQHGALAIQQGRFASMVDSLSGASERSAGQGIWHHALTRALVESGDHDRAVHALEALVEPRDDFMWLVSQQFSATAAAMLSHRDSCSALFDALLPYRGRLGVVASGTIVYELVSTTLGRLAVALERPDLAEELFREALVDADRIGAIHLATITRVALAGVLTEGGAPSSEAAELLAVALGDAERFGFAAEIAAIAEVR